MTERRRSERITLQDKVIGRVKASIQARLVDLSVHGAQLECSTGLPPAGEVDVWLPTPRGEARIKAIVRRCRAQTGPSGMVFRAGVEFHDIDDDTRQSLEAALLDMGGSAPARVFERRPSAPPASMEQMRGSARDPLDELERMVRQVG